MDSGFWASGSGAFRYCFFVWLVFVCLGLVGWLLFFSF